MKYVIMSDIHGNLEALNVCLEEFKKQPYDILVCLGDFVGYGPNPNEVVEWAIQYKKDHPNSIFVYGNHDRAIADLRVDLSWYNLQARSAIVKHRKILSDDVRKFLLGLNEKEICDGLEFVHGSPRVWDEYIQEGFEALDAMDYMHQDSKLCFIGHTHVPKIWSNQEDMFGRPSNIREGEPLKRIVNVGSVGQSRDWNSQSCFVRYDGVTDVLEYVRVPYDIKVVQDRMMSLGSDPWLIERLQHGS